MLMVIVIGWIISAVSPLFSQLVVHKTAANKVRHRVKFHSVSTSLLHCKTVESVSMHILKNYVDNMHNRMHIKDGVYVVPVGCLRD